MTRTDSRARFWHRLFRRRADAAAPAPSPPLFALRPVPRSPAGPGLPAWDEIHSAAPPVIDPGPMLTLVPDAMPAAPAGSKRQATEEERRVLAQIGALLGSAQIEQAAALLDQAFRERPEVCDAQGRPLYLLESLHCALLLGEAEAAADRARRLRPHLAPDDPVIELLYGRIAVAAGDRAAARTNWQAALARAPELAEARDWLAAHPTSTDNGVAALDLLGPAGAELAGAIQPSPSLAAAPAEPAAVPDWLPARLLTGAALTVAGDGSVGAAPATARARPVTGAAPQDLALAFRNPEGLGRGPGFAELALAAFVVQRQYLGHLRPARAYVGRQAWALPPLEAAAAAMQAEMLAVLFPGIRVVGDHDDMRREANALVVDGALRNAATGTLIGGMMPQVAQWAAEARARVHAAFGLPATAEPSRDPVRNPGRRPRVLYLHAAPPRTLAEPVRERLFAMFIAAGYEVVMGDVTALPWPRQVRLAYGADVITGAHGPAFGVALWAHPQTRVLEFFPEGTRRYDGQLVAEAAGLSYLGLEGRAERGFVIHARQRWGPPVGKANRLVWALPWTMLEQALAVPKPGG